MIVRSQDKGSLIMLENCTRIFKSEIIQHSPNHSKPDKICGCVICAECGENTVKLGEYKSEETALKVLDEIQDLYSKTLRTINFIDAITSMIDFPKVYQMPPDETEETK